jgi:hypothetical protein
VKFGYSEKFGRDMPRLQTVPGWPHNDIEIHYGNYPNETEGCTLVGTSRGVNFVGGSRDAFWTLIGKLPKDFEITYVDMTSMQAGQAQ